MGGGTRRACSCLGSEHGGRLGPAANRRSSGPASHAWWPWELVWLLEGWGSVCRTQAPAAPTHLLPYASIRLTLHSIRCVFVCALLSGKSPGYGITLVAETTAGCLISAEACHVAPSRQQVRRRKCVPIPMGQGN